MAAGKWGWVATAVVLAAGAAWWVQRPDPVPAAALSVPAAVGMQASLGSPAAMPDGEEIPLPSYLQGRTLSELPVDERGHLRRSFLVRDWFEQYLVVRNDLKDDSAMDALMRQQIVRQLKDLPARDEALALWPKYRAYKAALAEGGRGATSGAGMAPLQAELERRRRLREQYLGDWAVPLFGEEDRNDHLMVARMTIATKPGLSEAERKRLLAEFDKANNIRSPDSDASEIADMRNRGASPESVRAAVEQRMGPEAAARYDQMQQQEQAWQANYQGYAQMRDQIAAQRLSPQDEDAQLALLRDKYFTDPADAARAGALDRIARRKASTQ